MNKILITLDILGKAIFDLDFESLQKENSEYLVRYNQILNNDWLFIRTFFSFFDNESNPLMKQAHLSVDWFNKKFSKILEDRRELLKSKNIEEKNLDLLSSMIIATENDFNFTEKNILDNCKLFFLAGHDTSATTACSTLHFLAKYPVLT